MSWVDLCYTVTVENEFVTWLNSQLRDRGWTAAELSRRAGISDSAISLVTSEQRNAGLDFCVKVANAFGESPEQALRLAGHLPRLPAPVAEEREALALFRRLEPQMRAGMLAALRACADYSEPRAPEPTDPHALSGSARDKLNEMFATMTVAELRLAYNGVMRRLREIEGQESQETKETVQQVHLE